MEKNEAEFMAKLLKTFKVEAQEHIKTISEGLFALEKENIPNVQRQELIEKIFREAHSLKGASRAVNQGMIQDFCQIIENIFSAWKRNEISSSPELFDALHASNDLIEKMVSQSGEKSSNCGELIEPMTHRLKLLLENKKESAAIKKDDADTSRIKPEIKPKEPLPVPSEEHKEPEKPPLPSLKPQVQRLPEQALRDQTIRVSIQKLDHLFQQVEELLNLKLAARKQASDLKSIQERLKKWDKKWIHLQPDLRNIQGLTKGDEFFISNGNFKKIANFLDWQQHFIKMLQDNLNRLVKITTQDYRLIGGIVDTLLEDTKKVLMQPFSTLLESFPRMVRDLSHELNKKIVFECQGEDLEVDRRILEEMKDPLIHLIRNSIDHGIENSNERIKNNKPPHGTIRIIASQVSGNSMELQITDDGKGIDAQKIKATAVRNNLISEKDANLMSDQEAVMLIFQSGLSTSPIITELSGRGLGLGIVSEKVDKLGGQIFIETKKGLGTTFRIVLPLTLATFRGIHITVSDRDFIMPTHNVQRVIRIKSEQINTIENRDTISIDGRILAYIHLSDLLGIPKKSNEQNRLISVLVVKAAEKTVAFGVDSILGEQDVLVKGLGKQLLRIKNFVAATITEWGTVIPILNPQDLVKSVIKGLIVSRNLAPPEIIQEKKAVILVAEDSITSRMLLKNILETGGFEVKTAVDGAEAFAIFQNESIDLLLTDVEMPRMDGFTLTEKVRALEKGKELPIVLCTSRESKEDRKHGIEVGANAYLEKTNFSQNNLLDVVKNLL